MSQQEGSPFRTSTLRVVINRLRFPWDWIRRSPDSSALNPKTADKEKIRSQVELVQRAFDGYVAVAASGGSRRAEDPADAAYLFRPDGAIVRDEETFGRLEAYFNSRPDTYRGGFERDDRQRRTDVTGILVRMPSRTDQEDVVLRTLDEVDAEFRPSQEEDPVGYQEYVDHPPVTPDHVLYVTYIKGSLCPANEPETVRVKEPWPPENPDTTVGTDVRVSVVDTGLWKGALTNPNTTWMDGVDCDPDDEEHVDPDAIHPYAGHGTFVSGVIQCLAPGSTIDVEGALTHGGAVYESEICEQLHQALESKEHPQLISISAGTYTRNDMALLGFEMLAAAHGLDDGEDTLVVAAAGNDNTDDRFWPAAFPWVVGVGSVDPDGNRSDYSNHGTWVDVYARGRDLVNAFPVGTYTCHEPQNIHNGVADVRQFSGLAQWSGTSFSTPVVTGLIAARMSAANESAQQAKTAVLKGATTTGGLPVVGPLT